MNNVFLFIFCISFLCIPVSILWALINLILKKPVKKHFISAGISALVLLISTVGFGLTMDNDASPKEAIDVASESSVTVVNSSTPLPTITPTTIPTVQPTEIPMVESPTLQPTLEPTAHPTEVPMPVPASNPQSDAVKYSLLSEFELDELQQLYLNFDSSLSYSDAVDYIISTGLPYSEEKYNGSRTIQIAFTQECTTQKYKKESGDFLSIYYVYSKDENSSKNDLDKYIFGTCSYVPADSTLQLIEHKNGHYYSYYESGNYISNLGTQLELDSAMTKEEQMLYYFNNK